MDDDFGFGPWTRWPDEKIIEWARRAPGLRRYGRERLELFTVRNDARYYAEIDWDRKPVTLRRYKEPMDFGLQSGGE